MTKYKPRIVLYEKPFKQLSWFTKNFDKEVGAFGVGEFNENYGAVTIKEWLFPKQTRSYAHITITEEMMMDLIKKYPLEKTKNIVCYWHVHPPGNNHPSSTDEEDSFDTLMDNKETGKSIRDKFSFIISTRDKDDKIDYMGRIEMRKPIIASIDAEITSTKDLTIEKECLKIIEDIDVKEKPKVASNKNQNTTVYNHSDNYYKSSNNNKSKVERALEKYTLSEEESVYISNTKNDFIIWCGDDFHHELINPLGLKQNIRPEWIDLYKVRRHCEKRGNLWYILLECRPEKRKKLWKALYKLKQNYYKKLLKSLQEEENVKTIPSEVENDIDTTIDETINEIVKEQVEKAPSCDTSGNVFKDCKK